MTKRPPIPSKMKMSLYKEAGMKCANPGCVNYRTHIHHIQEWAVYQTHDEKHMIAVCPSCHDEIHHGKLKIDDETLYRWKGIKRGSLKRDHLYIEPSSESKMLVGGFAIKGIKGVSVFELTKNSRVTYRLEDEDIFLLNLTISDLKGKEILKVVENHVKYKVDDSINFERRHGRFKITTNRILDFVPIWSIPIMLNMKPQYKIKDGNLTLIDVEVVEPGVVRIEGFWSGHDAAILINNESTHLMRRGINGPLTIIGGGGELTYNGKVDGKIFGID